jgi:exodeoxyribonuclease VII large subunit
LVNDVFQDTQPRALSVSELNHQARHLLETSFMQVGVEGELSGFSRPSSGHWYFSLKDRNCQIRCAMFRSANQRVRPAPKEGELVRIRGKVTLYENRGDFQIIVEHLEPAGAGALQQAFEALKLKLFNEGLFGTERKKPIPVLPRRIGVVTSPTGAAIHDILTVLARRCPGIPVTLYPTAVQGQAATADIVAAIGQAVVHNRADVLIIGRGGGSLEDLWCFNEEAVARAIAACPIATVSAVGHEVDTTIADYVADLRAPTPSAAAEKVSPDQNIWLRQLQASSERLQAAMGRQHTTLENRLLQLSTRLKDPRRSLQDKAQRLDGLDLRLSRAMAQITQRLRVRTDHLQQRLAMQSPNRQLASARERVLWATTGFNLAVQQALKSRREQLDYAAQTLNLVSPLATLGRGYAIVKNDQGKIVRRAGQLEAGQTLSARVANGTVHAQVISCDES